MSACHPRPDWGCASCLREEVARLTLELSRAHTCRFHVHPESQGHRACWEGRATRWEHGTPRPVVPPAGRDGTGCLLWALTLVLAYLVVSYVGDRQAATAVSLTALGAYLLGRWHQAAQTLGQSIPAWQQVWRQGGLGAGKALLSLVGGWLSFIVLLHLLCWGVWTLTHVLGPMGVWSGGVWMTPPTWGWPILSLLALWKCVELLGSFEHDDRHP
jgi:hypothetical protein